MTNSNFDKRLLIEQVRYMEAVETLACDTEDASADLSTHSDFEHRLWRRAQHIVGAHNLTTALVRAARLSRYTNSLGVFVAALCGMFGILYAITDSHTINIYWLLLVLLGFNLMSMLLWFIGISLNMGGLIAGVLARLTRWLPDHVGSKSQVGTQADRAWLACNYGGRIGKWQFSKIAHQLWLVYLLAGLTCLVLLLMVRQYDFVWGTTLLTDNAFIKLTNVLSTPLDALGLSMPSAEQVQHTRIGEALTLTAEYRYRWAQFLLGALLCFGIAPRLLLWCWSAIMLGSARRRFTLDHYLPYYINLRQQLMPLASHGQIIDADLAPPIMGDPPVITPEPHRLPEPTKWIAVELDDDIHWPPVAIDPGANLGHVIDRGSLERILQQLQSGHFPVIAVAALATRAPDRGVQRAIASLLSGTEQRWLVLLQRHQQESISSTRLAAWYRLAEACKVPADHVISMSLD